MGTPCMSFLMDEFNWRRKRAAIAFGVAVLVLGLPTVLFFQEGVFDEYDYWAGTVSLVLFATLEIILFSWVFGLKKGWVEITHGADIKVPIIFRFILKWVTPFMLLGVFFGSLVRPANDEWSKLGFKGWELHKESILGQMMHKGIGPNNAYFADSFYAEQDGMIDSLYTYHEKTFVQVTDTSSGVPISSSYRYKENHQLMKEKGDWIKKGEVLYTGSVINKIFFIDISRFLLFTVFVLIGITVYIAYRRRKKSNRI